MSNTVYLNGQYKAVEDATISVMDRGFLFGDGVYEVIPVFGGNLLALDKHLKRLLNSLDRIGLQNPCSRDEWLAIFAELLDTNSGHDRAIYLQVSRGAYVKRDLSVKTPNGEQHPPTVFAMVLQVTPPDLELASAGISVITVDDFRWNACDIKSTSLVANVMLKQQAAEAGMEDAILIKDGGVTEGTASNVFIIKDGVLITPPTSHKLLPGITRDLVIEIAKNNTILVEERDIKEAELYEADEIWMTSSTREIAPVICLNGNAVGRVDSKANGNASSNASSKGVAGEMWKRMMDLYQQHKQTLRQGG